MYIEAVANRNSPPAVLLRESYREDGKVRKRTLANLSCLSGDVIEGLKLLLRGGVAVTSAAEVFSVERSLPHGHVAAVLGSARGSGAMAWFGAAPKELQPLLLAMLVARVIAPLRHRVGNGVRSVCVARKASWNLRIWVSSSFLRHYGETQMLLKSHPQILAKGADGEHAAIR